MQEEERCSLRVVFGVVRFVGGVGVCGGYGHALLVLDFQFEVSPTFVWVFVVGFELDHRFSNRVCKWTACSVGRHRQGGNRHSGAWVATNEDYISQGMIRSYNFRVTNDCGAGRLSLEPIRPTTMICMSTVCATMFSLVPSPSQWKRSANIYTMWPGNSQ